MIGTKFEDIDGNSGLPLKRYDVVAKKGHPTEKPGTVITVTMWDGVSPWSPPEHTKAKLA